MYTYVEYIRKYIMHAVVHTVLLINCYVNVSLHSYELGC